MSYDERVDRVIARRTSYLADTKPLVEELVRVLNLFPTKAVMDGKTGQIGQFEPDLPPWAVTYKQLIEAQLQFMADRANEDIQRITGPLGERERWLRGRKYLYRHKGCKTPLFEWTGGEEGPRTGAVYEGNPWRSLLVANVDASLCPDCGELVLAGLHTLELCP